MVDPEDGVPFSGRMKCCWKGKCTGKFKLTIIVKFVSHSKLYIFHPTVHT